MKRCRFGLALLLVLLALSLGTGLYMQRVHAPLAEQTRQAALHAAAGDWTAAREGILAVRSQWETGWPLAAALADHSPMEAVNALLEQALSAAQFRDTAAFCSLCGRLRVQLEAMTEAHALTWWNLL